MAMRVVAKTDCPHQSKKAGGRRYYGVERKGNRAENSAKRKVIKFENRLFLGFESGKWLYCESKKLVCRSL